MNRLKAKTTTLFQYGSLNKCFVTVNVNQIWEVATYPTEVHPWYGLQRKGVTIQIPKEDLDRTFEVVW